MMLSVMLLSILMILLSILSVIRHLIFSNNLNWLLNLNRIYETLEWGRTWLVDFNAEKNQLVLFDQSNDIGAIDVKMDRHVLEEKSFFKMLLLTFSSKLDWSSCIISIAKSASKKMKFLSPEVVLYLYQCTICPCMEYCCHAWAGAFSCYLELLDKLQKRICRTVDPSLAASLEPLAHRRNVTSLRANNACKNQAVSGSCVSEVPGFFSFFDML